MGFSLYLSGELDRKFSGNEYDFSQTQEWNDKMGHTPAWRTLFFARLPIPFFGAGLCVLLFYFLKKVLHWFPAFLASLWLGNHPLMIKFSSLALQDIPAFFFALLFLVSLISIDWRRLDELSKGKRISRLIITGLLLGLAIGTKMNNLILLLILVIYLFWIMFSSFSPNQNKFEFNKARFNNWLFKNAIIILTGFIIFEVSNPYLYSHTSLALFQLNNIVKSYRASSPEQALWNFWEKIRFFNQWVCYNQQIILKWAGYFLAGLGLFFLLRKIWRKEELDKNILSLLIVCMFVLLNLWWISLAWIRLLLPLLIPLAILIGYGLEGILNLVKKSVKKLIFSSARFKMNSK